MIKRSNLYFYVTIALVTTLSEILKATGDDGSNLRKDYATRMLSYMNLSESPCNDFYEYACGNWKNVIEDRRSVTKRNNMLEIGYKLDDIVENILQRADINDVAPEYAEEFKLTKKFYFNCLEAKLHPMKASSEYLAVLKEIGGFPAVDADWNSKQFHWLNMSAHLSNYDVKNFVAEGIVPSYPYSPYFTVPSFGLEIELHHDTINNKSSNAYKTNEKHMRNILNIYGVKENHIGSTITEVFDFLEKIVKLLKEFDESPYTCETLSEPLEKSDLATIKEKWRIYYDIAWSGRTFENFTEIFNLYGTPCVFLYKNLDKICEENKQAAANYLSLKFLYEMDARVEDKAHQKDFCVSNLKTTMIYFFDHLYMKLYFDDAIRQEIDYIVKEIRQSLRKILQNADWLDDTTRKAALLKESAIKEHIGRYEDQYVTKLMIGELKELKFVGDSFEANYLNLRKFKQSSVTRFNGLNFEKLSNNTKLAQFLVGMQPDSNFYLLDNSLYLMAGTLNVPAYNKAWPNSLKFGTLGYTIGFLFTHGFGVAGANFDENGNLNNWWSSESAKIFKERYNCFDDYYKKYLIPEINRFIDANQTLNGIISDGGGLNEALMAYRHYVKDVDRTSPLYREEQMPGIDLSPEQIFFLGFAQMWCSSYKEANYWEELKTTTVIDNYRVLGALSNNEDFAKVYNCSVGSKMNPSANKCKVW